MAARNVMESIRLQSEDLRDELKELDLWEDEIAAKQAARKTQKAPAAAGSSRNVEPPIRGSVPSIKAAVTKAVEEKRKNSGPDPLLLAKDKGNEYFRLHQLGEAIAAYTKGIDMDPNDSAAHILYANRAMCYLKQEQWEKAERDASTCVSMNSAYPKAYYRRAMARKGLGKLKEARTDLEAVLALAPADASARSELETVTKMLQMERAKQETSTKLAKKIVIEEVDDDDEEDGDDAEDVSAEKERAYQQRLKEQQEEVERREREAEQTRRAKIEEENRARARARQSDRVEIIEEVEEVVPAATTTSTPAPKPAASAASAAAESTEATTSPTSQVEAAPRKLPTARLTKESLKAPKSYTEFERVFNSIEKDEESRNHYVAMLNPSTLRALFGSNLTPEILHGILESVKQLPELQAFELVKGLSTVNRIDDITSFFSEEESQLMEDVLNYVKGSGSTSEIASITKKLKPF